MRVADSCDFREQISRTKLRHVWISGDVRHRGDFDVDFLFLLFLLLRKKIGAFELFAQKSVRAGWHRKHDDDSNLCACVCVIYIYIYISACCSSLMIEEKKSGVGVSFCALSRQKEGFFENLLFFCAFGVKKKNKKREKLEKFLRQQPQTKAHHHHNRTLFYQTRKHRGINKRDI